jgi:SAM-dependent methyltransferase
MEPREYAAMFAVEDRHWWYRGVRKEIQRALRRANACPGTWLDAGCGTGGLLDLLNPTSYEFGVDVSPLALRLARSRGLTRLAQASVGALPFHNAGFDCITSIDVLAHRLVEEGDALRELHRCLTPGGLLMLQLPAFDALRGGHDDAVWTRRRYRKTEVAQMLRSSGFEVREIFYRNSLLFPVAALRRLLARRSRAEEPRSDVSRVPAPINTALFLALELDARLRGAGLRLPFGLSVFCVARKAKGREQQG